MQIPYFFKIKSCMLSDYKLRIVSNGNSWTFLEVLGKVFMGNKGNRFLSIISTILLFALVAFLYVVPSIETIRNGSDVITLSSSISEEGTIENKKEVSTPVEPKPEENKSSSLEENDSLHVHRDIKIQGYHLIVDAYDGYGFIKVPSNLSEDNILYGLSQASEIIGSTSSEIDFILEPGQVSLVYNQGHSKEEINGLLDLLQSEIGAVEIIIPAKPDLHLFTQEIVDSIKSFTIEKTLHVLGTPIEVSAERGSATFTYPAYVSKAEVEEVLLNINNLYGSYTHDLYFFIEDGKTVITFPSYYEKEDVESALSLLDEYLSSITPEPELVIPAVPVKPNLYLANQELSNFTVEKVLYVLETPIEVSAERGNAIFSYPAYISKADVEDVLFDLNALYSSYTSNLYYSIEDGITKISFPSYYEKEDIEFAISILESYLAAIEPTAPESEPEIITPTIPEKSVISVEQKLESIEIIRTINTPFGTVSINACNDFATIELPTGISEEEIASGLSLLCSTYKLTDFDFATENNVVEAIYSDIYSEKDINEFIDGLELFLSNYQITESVISIPQKPLLSVSDIVLKPLHIHREMVLLDDVVTVDAYDGYAVFIFPNYIDDESLANGIVELINMNYPLFVDYDFALGDNLIATYSEGYSEKQISEMLDKMEVLLNSIEKPLPEPPYIEVADMKLDDIHIQEKLNILGVDVKIDLYDGIGSFSYNEVFPQESVADVLVSICSICGGDLDDFDFAIDDTSIDIYYSEGYTEDELFGFISKIKNAFDREVLHQEIVFEAIPDIKKETVEEDTLSLENAKTALYPADKFSMTLSLSPLSVAMGFFYNIDETYYTYKGWAAELALSYKFNKNFGISLEGGYSEYQDFNNRRIYQVPVVVSSDFHIPLGNSERFSLLFGLGAGVSFSNIIDVDINWVGEAKAGFNYRLSENLALNFRSTWRVTVPVKYMDKQNENSLLTANNLIGLSYIF